MSSFGVVLTVGSIRASREGVRLYNLYSVQYTEYNVLHHARILSCVITLAPSAIDTSMVRSCSALLCTEDFAVNATRV